MSPNAEMQAFSRRRGMENAVREDEPALVALAVALELGRGPRSRQALAARLNLPADRAEQLVDALIASGLVETRRNRLANAPEVEEVLDGHEHGKGPHVLPLLTTLLALALTILAYQQWLAPRARMAGPQSEHASVPVSAAAASAPAVPVGSPTYYLVSSIEQVEAVPPPRPPGTAFVVQQDGVDVAAGPPQSSADGDRAAAYPQDPPVIDLRPAVLVPDVMLYYLVGSLDQREMVERWLAAQESGLSVPEKIARRAAVIVVRSAWEEQNFRQAAAAAEDPAEAAQEPEIRIVDLRRSFASAQPQSSNLAPAARAAATFMLAGSFEAAEQMASVMQADGGTPAYTVIVRGGSEDEASWARQSAAPVAVIDIVAPDEDAATVRARLDQERASGRSGEPSPRVVDTRQPPPP